jgi:hypothetical protein
MRRFVLLSLLLIFALPFGISLAGCSKGVAVVYCNGQNAGVVVGQLTVLTIGPASTGISLNQGEQGQLSAPTGKDCKQNSASFSGTRYASTDLTLADIVPTTGRICAGTWNRNTGGGIADYTVCTPASHGGTAFLTASADGVTSNSLPIFIHPVVTSIVLGPASTNCNSDPASNCYPFASSASIAACVSGNPATPISYNGNSCISQNSTATLAARVYTGTDITNAANNISCQVGPLAFSAQNPSVVTIDATGLATAAQPGATIINAATSQASSSAGFFATCPPASIVLTTVGSTTAPTAPVDIAQNVSQSVVATVTDTQGAPITNISLTYVSTSPTTIPITSSVITPTFPGAAAVTAICQPPTCNSSPYNLIGLNFGGGPLGEPVLSNPVDIVATGTPSSTILYIASTQSQYVQPVDFTVSSQQSPLRLPYVPNSMVLSTDLSSLYLGTTTEIMIVSATTSGITLARQDPQVAGTVLAVSPDSGTIVITDPNRNLVYLYTSSGAISTEYGGTGTRAVWSPDSSTVYVTTTDGRMLVHSTNTGWSSVNLANVATDVTLTVPQAGVYLGNNPGQGSVTARTNCPTSTVSGSGLNTVTTNAFYPQADVTAVSAFRVAATNDGLHVLGASLTNFSDLTTNAKAGACPYTFTSATRSMPAFATAVLNGITGVLPTSDSAFAFVTYTGTGSVAPQYNLASGSLTNIALQTTSGGVPIAPVAGVVSSDNNTVYLGTTGDNLVHRLTRGTSGFSDTVIPVTPALPNVSGSGVAVPNLIQQRPRRSNS